MILILIPFVVGAWLLSGWSIMLLTGMVHHEILPAVIPISYTVGLKFAAVIVLLTSFSGIVKGVVEANKS